MMGNVLRWRKILNHKDLQSEFKVAAPFKQKPFCMKHYLEKLETTPTHLSTVGDSVLNTLSNWGIQQAFGVSKGRHSELAARLKTQDKITYFEVNHEDTAAYAASAYGSLTGRPAACCTTDDASSTDLLNALWDANINRAPVIALSAHTTPTEQQTHPATQIQTEPQLSQWSRTIHSNRQHAEITTLACKSAILNRGVSHLVLPDKMLKLPDKDPTKTGSPQGRLPSQNIAPPHDALQDAITLLRTSKRPAIVVGHGARNRMEPVIQLAEQLRAPVVTTFKGKGLFPENHSLAGGVLGFGGSPVASELVNEADALLVFGASFSKETGITGDRPTVQVDYDLKALAKFHPIDVPVWGEIGVTAQALSDDFLGDMWTQDQTESIAAHWASWHEAKQKRILNNGNSLANPAILFEMLSDVAEHDAIISLDIDQTTQTFGQHFQCTEQAILMSGRPNSIGFALPAAMGAWSATQESNPAFNSRQVISISGITNVGHSLSEFATAVKHNMNINHILIRPASDDSTHTYADYVEQCGAMGLAANDKAELKTALQHALTHNRPALIEVIINTNR